MLLNKRVRIYLILTCLFALFIFYLSSQSDPGNLGSFMDKLDFMELRKLIKSFEISDYGFIFFPFYLFYRYPDKVLHAILYAGFGFLLYLTIKNSSHKTLNKYAFMFAIMIGTIYGISDEFHQSFVPGRTASINDLFADTMGLTIAQTIIFIKHKLYFIGHLFIKKEPQ